MTQNTMPPDEDQGYNADPSRPNQNWDTSSVDKGKIIFGILVVGAALVLIFAVSMCSRESVITPSGEAVGGADILQRNVDAAFDTTREAEQDNKAQNPAPAHDPQALPPSTTQQESQRREEAQTIEERELQALEQQQQIQQQREEMEQQQREAIPSLLPENPPTPAKLGNY